ATKRILVELALLGNRVFAAAEKRRIHRPPTHHQIDEHADQRLVKETAPHRKKELFAPARFAKQRGRHYIHIEKRSMIRDQKNGTIVVDGFDVFEAVDAHQVVSRNVNPTRAKKALAPGPETLPAAKIHAIREAKSETLEGRKHT